MIIDVHSLHSNPEVLSQTSQVDDTTHPTRPLRKTDLTEARNKIKGAKKDTYTSKEVLGTFRGPGHSKSLTPRGLYFTLSQYSFNVVLFKCESYPNRFFF